MRAWVAFLCRHKPPDKAPSVAGKDDSLGKLTIALDSLNLRFGTRVPFVCALIMCMLKAMALKRDGITYT